MTRARGWSRGPAHDHRLVGVSRRSGNRLLLDRALHAAGARVTWAYETEHLSSGLGLVEAGLGVAVVPRLALPRGRHPVLVARPIGRPVVERAAGILLRQGASLSPGAQACMALVEERMAA